MTVIATKQDRLTSCSSVGAISKCQGHRVELYQSDQIDSACFISVLIGVKSGLT